MSVTNFPIKKFNMKQISFKPGESSGPVIVLIGRRNTGKSFLIRDILYHHQDIPLGTVISGSEDADPFYQTMIPRVCIHFDYDSSIIGQHLKRQKAVLKVIHKQIEQYGRTNIDGRTFCILDDCLHASANWKRDPLMRNLFMNGRHWKIMLIIAMQYSLGIGPNLRTNIDYTFILREGYKSNRKRIWENYASMFPTFESFNQVMDQCTEDWECLVVYNNSKSNKLSDQIFYYKAEKHDDFKLCAKQVWDDPRNHYSSDEEEDEFDMNTVLSKGQRINVKKQW